MTREARAYVYSAASEATNSFRGGSAQPCRARGQAELAALGGVAHVFGLDSAHARARVGDACVWASLLKISQRRQSACFLWPIPQCPAVRSALGYVACMPCRATSHACVRRRMHACILRRMHAVLRHQARSCSCRSRAGRSLGALALAMSAPRVRDIAAVGGGWAVRAQRWVL